MTELIEKYKNLKKWPYILEGVILIVIIIFSGAFYLLRQEMQIYKNDIASSIEIINQRIVSLESGLASTSEDFSKKLLEQQNQTSDFQNTISDITDTVGTLEKLSKTDKELLQKYSRVYFLNDNYVPMQLKDIDTEYLLDPKKDAEFHALALPYLERMINRAENAEVTLKIASAYRSFGTQSALKNGYLITYGSGANQFSADQGYSEHQLGTAVDLTEPGLVPALSVNFEKTKGFIWLENNAYKYGFVLSYPKNNNFYQYEPWHWRFVGVKLATKLHQEGINFSDMEQREIDTYLVKIFD